jgi:carboxypeptidase C (cathepsin A)
MKKQILLLLGFLLACSSQPHTPSENEIKKEYRKEVQAYFQERMPEFQKLASASCKEGLIDDLIPKDLHIGSLKKIDETYLASLLEPIYPEQMSKINKGILDSLTVETYTFQSVAGDESKLYLYITKNKNNMIERPVVIFFSGGAGYGHDSGRYAST